MKRGWKERKKCGEIEGQKRDEMKKRTNREGLSENKRVK